MQFSLNETETQMDLVAGAGIVAMKMMKTQALASIKGRSTVMKKTMILNGEGIRYRLKNSTDGLNKLI